MTQSKSAIVVGAGPAGLTAACELVKLGRSVTVIEQDPAYVGGLARTECYKGFRFDLGAHRFFSKNPEINIWWKERLGDDLLEVRRLTRILYRGRFFHYPLRLLNVLSQFGPMESLKCVLSYFRSCIVPASPELSFEDWVQNRFGRRLFQIFFKTYTEKVWGMGCAEISADWAAQRIQGFSLSKAALSSIGFRFRQSKLKTIADRFQYPRLGCGMMWERTRDELVRAGVKFEMGKRVSQINRSGTQITGLETVNQANESAGCFSADDYILSMPLRDAVLTIQSPLPADVRDAAEQLRYRNMLIILLVVKKADVFPDQWIYIHDPSVAVGRISNTRNWSIDLVPDLQMSGLVLDYFSSEGEPLWHRSDKELLKLASQEIEAIGLVAAKDVVDGTVLRLDRAYPVFDAGYKTRVERIKEALHQFQNLFLAGRNGLHKYNNQDHSMLTGIMAARAANGEEVDPWKVNIDAFYQEEASLDDSARAIPTLKDRGKQNR